MNNSTYVYLAINNPILLKGFEGIIQSQSNNVTLYPVAPISELFQLNFKKDPEIPKIILYDSSEENDHINLLLFNLLQNNPDLKVLFLIKEFDYKKIKFLFNFGIYGVLSKDILPEDFLDMLRDALDGKKCLSPNFREKVIKKFCQKEKVPVKIYEEMEVSIDDIGYTDRLFGLTKREKEILCLICNGKNTKEISEELFISLHTAETHRRNLLYKLDVKNTAEMVKVAIVSKLITV